MNILISVLIVTLGLGIDQFSKYLVSSKMILKESINIIPHFFSITYVRNTGAGFSILEGKQSFFFVVTIISLVLFIYLYKKANSNFERYTVALVIAGTLGNFVDRLLYGSVVDFLDFIILGYDFPVFNLADCYLTIGIILYIYISYKEGKNA